jgi:hypothetical protein
MRAAIEQAEELAVDVEDRDRPLIDDEELARAWRQFADGRNDVTGHAGFLQTSTKLSLVMPRLDPGIHHLSKRWIAGSSPAMTIRGVSVKM